MKSDPTVHISIEALVSSSVYAVECLCCSEYAIRVKLVFAYFLSPKFKHVKAAHFSVKLAMSEPNCSPLWSF